MIHPAWMETPRVRELLPHLARIEQGEEIMTRDVLLRVIETLSFWTFGSGVNLFAYNDSNKTDEENAEDTDDEMWAHMKIGDDWHDAWCNCSRPEWMSIIADILKEPPSNWGINDDSSFPWFFLAVAEQCPDETVQMLSSLLRDENTRPRAELLLAMLGDATDEG